MREESRSTLPGGVRYRAAGPDDAGSVARLHADSWRRHYRGTYADAYLDGDILTDRRAVWSARLAAAAGTATLPAGTATLPATATLLAEDDTGPVGFVHVVFDDDDRWGSLVDNLHVAPGRQRAGIGTGLLARAATPRRRSTGRSAVPVFPLCYRIAWPDAAGPFSGMLHRYS